MADPSGLRADSARNRAQLLDAARQELAEGATTLSMNALASHAGVGVGTVYRHFPTLEILLESLAIGSFRKLVDQARAAADATDPAAAFEELLRGAQVCLLEDPALAIVLMAPAFTCADVLRLGSEFFESVAVVLERARGAGVLREDVTGDDLRRLMNGLQQAVRTGTSEAAERYLQILLRGLRP
jgi:AcrR family transcriptional regulator